MTGVVHAERWPLDRLVPSPRNPRTHSDAQVAQLAASMREWGWTMPVLVDEDGNIIAGHGRVMAARKLAATDPEFASAPILVARGWSEATLEMRPELEAARVRGGKRREIRTLWRQLSQSPLSCSTSTPYLPAVLPKLLKLIAIPTIVLDLDSGPGFDLSRSATVIAIPTIVLDLDSVLAGEFSENEFRKNFTPSERAALSKALQEEIAAKERRGRPTKESRADARNIPEGDTRDLAAKRAGFTSTETMQRAQHVVEKGHARTGAGDGREGS